MDGRYERCVGGRPPTRTRASLGGLFITITTTATDWTYKTLLIMALRNNIIYATPFIWGVSEAACQ